MTGLRSVFCVFTLTFEPNRLSVFACAWFKTETTNFILLGDETACLAARNRVGFATDFSV